MKKIVLLPLFLISFGLLHAQENRKEDLKNFLKDHWKTPEEYVVSKFHDHDYVFIGEYHRIKHDVELIANLIPLLYKNHICNLAIEFGIFSDQHLVDSLINAPTFNRKLADSIVFSYYPVWGYKEYINLYETAWKVNHSDLSDTTKFRIINLGCLYNPCTKDRFAGNDPDEYMANTILKELVAKDQKALIYSGGHHAFTRYRQPLYDFNKDTLYGFKQTRMGNIIYDSLKERVFNIYLHAGWVSNKGFDADCVLPVNGAIDDLMENFTDKRVGFDVVGAPYPPYQPHILGQQGFIYKLG
ncbi:MAG: hypothetical protein Q8M08_03250 [Bacteroidales bacterium]|nr:hypothetical protein [Bacteroidales bacterium]